MSNATLSYDFSHPVFQKNFIYKRLAKEHMALSEIESDVISCEVVTTVGPLKVPNKYLIHYNFKTITGVDADQNPIYGDHHVAEIDLPKKYPLEAAKIYMKTPVWHPNIKFSGQFKGRVCGNTRDFGKGYDLYQLVLRLGEILQYKNYHAVHAPPYPEDAQVADWVLQHAEPNDIVNKAKGIAVDDSQLLGHTDTPPEPEEPEHTADEKAGDTTPPPESEPGERPKIKLTDKGVQPKSGIRIKRK